MGKTSQPLKILCVGIWGDEFVTLQDQGHTVDHLVAGELIEHDITEYDLVVGPKCWRLLPHLVKYLPLAIKEARAAKPKKAPRAKD